MSEEDATSAPATSPSQDGAPTIAPAGALIGELPRSHPASIGRYRILRLLGEGGMGAVYEAEQDQPRRLVALKLIRAAWAAPEMLRRFGQESEALGRLHHPGIAQIYEAGSVDTAFGVQPFFAMELIHGKPLVEWADGHKLTTRQRLELVAQVCDAVEHAHQRGIIHRDLKPGNILVDESGQPKILDFGLARATDSDANATRQTDVGQLLGTLAYMSPEQVLADPLALDTRSDVYALGVILYELLARKLPYMLSGMLHEALRTIQQTDPAPLSSINRTYRGDIETIVARPASAAYRVGKFARRHKALVAGVAAVFVVLVTGIVASTREAVLARRAEKKAQQQSDIARAVNDFLQRDLLAQASAYNQSKPDPDLKVRTALDRAAQNIGGKFTNQPEVEAAIRRTIGETYYDLGLYSEAAQQLTTALEQSRRTAGPESPATLAIEDDLAAVQEKQGKYADAEKLSTEVISIDRRVFGADDPNTLRAIEDLAIAYGDDDKLAQAVPLHQQVIDADRRRFGADDPVTLAAMDDLVKTYENGEEYAKAEALGKQVVDARGRGAERESPAMTTSMQNLASVYVGEGKYAEAEAMYNRALEIERRIFGPEHAKTLMAMESLAEVQIAEGNYSVAESQLRRIVETDRRVLGPESPDTLYAMQDLAVASGSAGEYASATRIEQQLLDVNRRLLGPDHSETIQTMGNVGWFSYEMGDYAGAERIDRQMLATTRRLYGDDHPNTVNAGGNLADVLEAEGKYKEAEKLYLETLATARRALGESHMYTLDVLYRLPEMYQREGKYDLAEKYAAEALAARRKTQGPAHAKTLVAECDLALADLSQGKFEQSEPLAKEAVDLETKTQPGGWQRYRAESLLGASLAGEKKFAEAEPLLVDAYREMQERQKQIAVPDRWNLDLAHRWLVQLYVDWGKTDKAAEWKNK